MIVSLAWSPAGNFLASASTGEGSEIIIWDMGRGEVIQTLSRHPGIISAAAWGSSEKFLISGSADGLLRWWDTKSGACMRTVITHQGSVKSLRRSPDGTQVASGGADGSIMIWNIENGDHMQTLRRDRPYERMNITGIRGLTEAQKANLRALGAE